MTTGIIMLVIITLTSTKICSAENDTVVANDTIIVNDTVLEEFIRVPGMRMFEYNYWKKTESQAECAQHCLEGSQIDCSSFSFSASAMGCGFYENSRSDAPPGVYGPPISLVTETGESPSWIYFERKSEGYKLLEQKMRLLENATEIDLNLATEMLQDFGSSLSTDTDDSGYESLTPGELGIISEMVQKLVVLNPIVNATPEDAEEFVRVLVNVNDLMIKPAHFSAWMTLQQDPYCGGITDLLISSEFLSRDVSVRLLKFDNSTSVAAEEADIGMWLEIVHYPEVTKSKPVLGFRDFGAELMEKIARVLNEHQENEVYIFPPVKNDRHVRRRGGSRVATPSRDSVIGGNVIKLPAEALRNQSVVSHVRYKHLQEVVPSRSFQKKRLAPGTTFSIVSSVLTTSVFPPPEPGLFEKSPVTIIFCHGVPTVEETETSTGKPELLTRNCKNESNRSQKVNVGRYCVFWSEGDAESPGGWSDEGCKLISHNNTHTVCKCSHLTSFAVLLQMVDLNVSDPWFENHVVMLDYISFVGCSLSFIGVTIMCITFAVVRFHTENMKIHFNLGVAVAAADLVFMFEGLAQDKHYSCVLVTILLYYTNMSVLSWMLVEGVFLYSQVVVVFVSGKRWIWYYLFAGWGIPAIITGIAMGILNVQLGRNKMCWLSPVDNSIWAFAAPALLAITINTFILIAVIRIIYRVNPDQSTTTRTVRIKNAIKGSIFLSPLLGTTWLFGLLSLSGETLLFHYLFAVTNSLQGLFLFVFHCLCNSGVRANVRRRSLKPGNSLLGFGRIPSFFGFNLSLSMKKRDSSASGSRPSQCEINRETDQTSRESTPQENISIIQKPEMEPRSISKILSEKPEKPKLPPILSMPKKNDYIKKIKGKSKVSPKETKELHAEEQLNSHDKDETPQISCHPAIFMNSDVLRDSHSNGFADDISMEFCPQVDRRADVPTPEIKNDSDRVIMSYDSGLNSIDNESFFDAELLFENDEIPYGSYTLTADGFIPRSND